MRNIITIILFLSLVGCATERVMITGRQFAATKPEKVVIYHTKSPKSHYQEIGRVSIDKYDNFAISRSGSEIDRLMREKAASVGGDAIISVSEDFGSISGVVIRTK
jgi:hypothetical protein